MISWVDYRDVAEAAAQAMISSELSRGTFELTAPGLFDSRETAAILSQIVGREIAAVHIPAGEFALRLPADRREAFMQMMDYHDRCELHAGNSLVMRTILQREPRSVSDYLRELHEAHWGKPGPP
jgi:hypothetical protein